MITKDNMTKVFLSYGLSSKCSSSALNSVKNFKKSINNIISARRIDGTSDISNLPTGYPIPKYVYFEAQLCKFEIIKDNKHEDGMFRINQKDGFVFEGMLVKDLFRNEDWRTILPSYKRGLYTVMHGGTRILRIDVCWKKKWHIIWMPSNDFDSFAENKKSTDNYNKFIQDEGEKVKKLIDNGKTYEQIKKKMSNEHSGNTYGMAIWYGISRAKNMKNANAVRVEHNTEYGVKKNKKGVVNPALFSIGERK